MNVRGWRGKKRDEQNIFQWHLPLYDLEALYVASGKPQLIILSDKTPLARAAPNVTYGIMFSETHSYFITKPDYIMTMEFKGGKADPERGPLGAGFCRKSHYWRSPGISMSLAKMKNNENLKPLEVFGFEPCVVEKINE